jgi:hypothetical protein
MIATVLRPVGAVERNLGTRPLDLSRFAHVATKMSTPLRRRSPTASRFGHDARPAHLQRRPGTRVRRNLVGPAAGKPEESPANQDHRKSPVAEAFSVAGL